MLEVLTLLNVYLDVATCRWKTLFHSNMCLDRKTVVNLFYYMQMAALLTQKDNELQGDVYVLSYIFE